MTRTFNEKVRCQTCGTEHTNESDFERWMRNERALDSSRFGLVRFDLDVLLHRYKLLIDGKGERDVQCMMFVEVKTRMANLSDAQRDTLHILDQLLRNRRPNINSTPRRQVLGQSTKVYSLMLGREVTVLAYGGHSLRLSGTDPDNSHEMLWDNKFNLSKDDLIELLLFERDPDRPHLKIDHRRRYRSWKEAPMLPGIENHFATK